MFCKLLSQETFLQTGIHDNFSLEIVILDHFLQVLQIVAKRTYYKWLQIVGDDQYSKILHMRIWTFLLSVLVDRDRCSGSGWTGLSRVILVIQVVQEVSLNDMHSD